MSYHRTGGLGVLLIDIVVDVAQLRDVAQWNGEWPQGARVPCSPAHAGGGPRPAYNIIILLRTRTRFGWRTLDNWSEKENEVERKGRPRKKDAFRTPGPRSTHPNISKFRKIAQTGTMFFTGISFAPMTKSLERVIISLECRVQRSA